MHSSILWSLASELCNIVRNYMYGEVLGLDIVSFGGLEGSIMKILSPIPSPGQIGGHSWWDILLIMWLSYSILCNPL